MAVKQPISANWQFKQADLADTEFLPVSQFPTVVHLDLLHHKKIPDPFIDLNQDEVQWIGEREWDYQTEFVVSPEAAAHNVFELVFEGLDTHAAVSLNGTKLFDSENMFVEYRHDVTRLLVRNGPNVVKLHFKSTVFVGKELEKQHGSKFLYWNGDSSRLAVRKAPYHYGWDWGPTLMTAGPWKPVWLESYTKARIDDVSFNQSFSESLDVANIDVQCTVSGASDGISASFSLKSPEGISLTSQCPVDAGEASTKFRVDAPDLWFPVGYGKQPLYQLKVEIFDGDTLLYVTSKKIGLRKLELIQKPFADKNTPGTTFFFQINGIPIFCKGSDWIPCDSFLPQVTESRLRDWVQLAVDGNQNMIRVWGGGVYEDDAFYDACDELGVLVWNDFQLACGAYPTDKPYLALLEQEAIYNVKRIFHHPSVVLWCGNNEDYMFAEVHGLEYNPKDTNPENWLKTNFSARYIYEKLLKDVCDKYCPQIPYHFGSPWDGPISNSPTSGDMHSWKVWMADLEQYPYQDYYKLSGRFVSEFGMKSYPNLKTVKGFITNESERYPQSKTMDAHQKAPRDQSTLAMYLIDNFRHGYTMEQYVYATQLLQAESMSFAYQSWRRLWMGPGKEECAGALVWQLNDCWPVVSWSLADYYLRPKAAYFTIKRDVAPIVVGMARRTREERKNEYTNVDIKRTELLQVWGSNFALHGVKAKVVVTSYNLSGAVLWTHTVGADLLANQSTELMERELDNGVPQIIFSRLIDSDGNVLARTSSWPQPLKFLDLPRAAVDISVSGDTITVTATEPVKGLIFELEHDEVKFDDNCLDLEPTVPQTVIAAGLKGRPVKALHLGIAY